jgi:hypothetical protein
MYKKPIILYLYLGGTWYSHTKKDVYNYKHWGYRFIKQYKVLNVNILICCCEMPSSLYMHILGKVVRSTTRVMLYVVLLHNQVRITDQSPCYAGFLVHACTFCFIRVLGVLLYILYRKGLGGC